MMLLFVCNGTDHSSITTDIRQILDIAYQDINEESMMPEQYNNWDIPKFSIRLNVPRLPQKSPLKTARLTIISESRGRRHSTWKLQNPTWRSSLSWPPTPTGWVWTQNILENLQNSRQRWAKTPLSAIALASDGASRAISIFISAPRQSLLTESTILTRRRLSGI